MSDIITDPSGPTPDPRVLTFEEVCEAYRLGKDGLRDHIANGLPHYRAGGKGGRYLFFAEQVRDYFAGLALRLGDEAAGKARARAWREASGDRRGKRPRAPRGGAGPIRTPQGYIL